MDVLSIDPKKPVVLAYTGGADAVASLLALIENGNDVFAFTGNIGQAESMDAIRESALANGSGDADHVRIKDMRKGFVIEHIWPHVKSDAIYHRQYLCGGALPKAWLGRTQAEIAKELDIPVLAHGATEGQNDKIRFRKGYSTVGEFEVYVPWEDPKFAQRFPTRASLIGYLEAAGAITTTTMTKPWTTEDHLYHSSFEDIELARFETIRRPDMLGVTPQTAPNESDYVEITFESGVPTQVFYNKNEITDPLEIMVLLNTLGYKHAVGQVDIVETNLNKSKTRGVYWTPGGTILRVAHTDLERAILPSDDLREMGRLADDVGDMTYAGDCYSDPMTTARNSVNRIQDGKVDGICNLTLYKGQAIVEGRTI